MELFQGPASQRSVLKTMGQPRVCSFFRTSLGSRNETLQFPLYDYQGMTWFDTQVLNVPGGTNCPDRWSEEEKNNFLESIEICGGQKRQ